MYVTPIVKSIIKRAALSEPKTAPGTGDIILYYGSPLYVIGSICIGIAVFIAVMAFFFVSPWEALSDIILFIIILVFFLAAGLACLLEAVRARGTITKDNILAEAPWPWYPRKILWNDITGVSFSGLSYSFVITSRDGRKTRISPLFNGIKYLIDCFTQRLQENVYHKAKPFIDEIQMLTVEK